MQWFLEVFELPAKNLQMSKCVEIYEIFEKTSFTKARFEVLFELNVQNNDVNTNSYSVKSLSEGKKATKPQPLEHQRL